MKFLPLLLLLPLTALAQQPTSADFQTSYDGFIKQISTDNVAVHAQLLADQRELAKLAAVEKERDELKAKLAEVTAIRGSTHPAPPVVKSPP